MARLRGEDLRGARRRASPRDCSMPQRAACWPSWGRADGDGVEELLDLRQARRRGQKRADPVAGEPVGLGKGIEVDQRVGPARVREDGRGAGRRRSGSRGRSSSRTRAMPASRARARKAARRSGEYSTPPGLFGVTRTMARVRSVTSARAVSGSGARVASVGSGTVVTPAMSSHILLIEIPGGCEGEPHLRARRAWPSRRRRPRCSRRSPRPLRAPRFPGSPPTSSARWPRGARAMPRTGP